LWIGVQGPKNVLWGFGASFGILDLFGGLVGGERVGG
jgi:hypothetical protein